MTLKPFPTVSIRKDLLIQETKSYKQKDSCNKLQLSFFAVFVRLLSDIRKPKGNLGYAFLCS